MPLTLGSDTNGSIRVPASLCGVWGLKPTFGRLSRRGSYPFVHSLDHLGPFADSSHDLALVYDALQGPDPLDPGCHALAVAAGGAAAGARHRRPAHRRARRLLSRATPAPRRARRWPAAAGRWARLDVVEWPDAALAAPRPSSSPPAKAAALHLADLRTRADDFEPLSVDRFIAGALLPAAWYVRAQRFRRVYRDKVNALFEHWDVLLAPATPCARRRSAPSGSTSTASAIPCRPSMGLLTQPISFAGCPVVAAPLWPTAGRACRSACR